MEREYDDVRTNGVQLHVVQTGPKMKPLSRCYMAFLNFGMPNYNPQEGLLLTKRMIISPSKKTQNG